jgi:hypothetical protein
MSQSNPVVLVQSRSQTAHHFRIAALCEQFCTDPLCQMEQIPQLRGRCHGEGRCQNPISSSNTPMRRCVGLAEPKPKKRNKPISTLRAHGRKRRYRASTFLVTPTIYQRSESSEAASVSGLFHLDRFSFRRASIPIRDLRHVHCEVPKPSNTRCSGPVLIGRWHFLE